MSWETDYDATSLTHRPATLRAAVDTINRRAHDDDDRRQIMQALGLAPYESKSRPKQAMRPRVDTRQVLALYDNGHSPTAIGRILGIQRQSVWHHIHKGRA